MKILIPILAVCMLAISGCATYGTSSIGGHTTIDIQNTGWYLFCCIPIASGEPNRPNQNDCRMFTDTVTLENNMNILRQAMIDVGAYKASNVVTHTTDEKVLFILLQRYACHTSAELSK